MNAANISAKLLLALPSTSVIMRTQAISRKNAAAPERVIAIIVTVTVASETVADGVVESSPAAGENAVSPSIARTINAPAAATKFSAAARVIAPCKPIVRSRKYPVMTVPTTAPRLFT